MKYSRLLLSEELKKKGRLGERERESEYIASQLILMHLF